MIYRRVLLCRECHKAFFSWKKLVAHLIDEHDYELPLEEAED